MVAFLWGSNWWVREGRPLTCRDAAEWPTASLLTCPTIDKCRIHTKSVSGPWEDCPTRPFTTERSPQVGRRCENASYPYFDLSLFSGEIEIGYSLS